MSLKHLRANLSFISSQPVDTSIFTNDGKQIKTQRLLLSAVSPYLAALISQVSHSDIVAISVPFSSEVIRDVLDNLASDGTDEECHHIENDELSSTVRELRIKFLMKQLKNKMKLPNLKKETFEEHSWFLEGKSNTTDFVLKDASYDELKADDPFHGNTFNRRHSTSTPLKQPSKEQAPNTSQARPELETYVSMTNTSLPGMPMMDQTSSSGDVSSNSQCPPLSDTQVDLENSISQHETSSFTRAVDIMKDVADNIKREMINRLMNTSVAGIDEIKFRFVSAQSVENESKDKAVDVSRQQEENMRSDKC